MSERVLDIVSFYLDVFWRRCIYNYIRHIKWLAFHLHLNSLTISDTAKNSLNII